MDKLGLTYCLHQHHAEHRYEAKGAAEGAWFINYKASFKSHWCQSWGSLVSTRCVVERSWGWGHLAASGAIVTTWAGPHTCRHWANIQQERNWASDLQTYTVFCIYLLPCCSHFISLQETISKALYFKWIILCKCLRSECWQHCHHSQAVSASAGNGHPGDSSRSDQCHHQSSLEQYSTVQCTTTS